MKGKYSKIQDEWRELHESEQIILRRLIQSGTKCYVIILTFQARLDQKHDVYCGLKYKNLSIEMCSHF